MAAPVWVTPAGSLGTIQERIFFSTSVAATDSDGDTLTYNLQSGRLPKGLTLNGVTGVIDGIPFDVDLVTESKFTVRVSDNDQVMDRSFSITVSGNDEPVFTTNPGELFQTFDCRKVSFQLLVVDLDPGDTIKYKLISGEFPPGVTLNEDTGLISGFIDKLDAATLPQSALVLSEIRGLEYNLFYDMLGWDSEDHIYVQQLLDGNSKWDTQGWDTFGWEFNSKTANLEFEFTIEATDDKTVVTQTNSIFVFSNDTAQADNTNITADNVSIITADTTTRRTPVLLLNDSDLGGVRHDNFWAFHFDAVDCDDETIEWTIATGADIGYDNQGFDTEDLGYDEGAKALPPGLVLDQDTGWLSGDIPSLGAVQTDFEWAIKVRKKQNPTWESVWHFFSMTIKGDLETAVVWLTPDDLGVIKTGEVSRLFVEAEAAPQISLIYEFDSKFGVKSGRMPQGMIVQPDGTLEGRISFRTFGLDQKTTTFDINTLDIGETTIDKTYTFDVTVRDTNGFINVKNRFTVLIDDDNYEPYENLYFVQLGDSEDRLAYKTFIQNIDIFPTELIYRPFDWYHGIQNELRMLLITGLKASSTEKFISEMSKNFYKKKILLGDLKVARAVDPNTDKPVYDVLYLDVKDQMENRAGTSQNNTINLSNSINAPVFINDMDITCDDNLITCDQNDFQIAFSNSYDNMRAHMSNKITHLLEQPKSLPLWMTSVQEDGNILGWIPAIPVCFAIPGEGNRIKFNIKGSNFNFKQMNFEVDRLEWDSNLSSTFNKTTREFIASVQTTFDRTNNDPGFEGSNETTWDDEAARWVSNIDSYIPDNSNDVYLKFPRVDMLN